MGASINMKFIFLLTTIWILVMTIYLFMPFRLDNMETYEDQTFQCPRAHEPFANKRLIKKGNCYDNKATSCESIVDHMKLNLKVDGMTDEQISTAINLMSANTYVDENGNSYNINECVISKKDAEDLKIKDCRLRDIELKNGNEHDAELKWANPDGCVVTQQSLQSNVGKILKHIYDKFREAPEETQGILNGKITENRNATRMHWDRYNANVSETGVQRSAERDARYRDWKAREDRVASFNAMVQAIAREPVWRVNSDYNDIVLRDMYRNCKYTWGPWSGCEGTCGTGKQRRTMIIEQESVNGGVACPPPHLRVQEQNCDTGRSCAVKRNYTLHKGALVTSYNWNRWEKPGIAFWIYADGFWNRSGTYHLEFIYYNSGNQGRVVTINYQIDDSGSVSVNGNHIGSAQNWGQQLSADAALDYGENLIRVTVNNGGGPTGLRLSCNDKGNVDNVLFSSGNAWRTS